jgi:hypothetical protein
MRDLLLNNKRLLGVIAISAAGVLCVLTALAAMVGLSTDEDSAPSNARPTPSRTSLVSSTSTLPTADPSLPAPSDVASVTAITPVVPGTSATYPAIADALRVQPDLYARAFATQLFTQSYATTSRGELMSWAQYESTPVIQPGLDPAGRAKLPVISLTDLAWEPGVLSTPIPPAGPWVSLAAQHGYSTVTDVRVTADPAWEKVIAGGFVPADPMLTVRIVSAIVTVHTTVAGPPVQTRAAVSLKLQLGTSTRGDGYGFVAAGSYVVKPVA